MTNYLKWGLITIAAVWAALIGTMLGYAWNIMHMPQMVPKVQIPQMQNTNISIETQEKMEGYWTVAVFGVDSREGTLGKGTRSDMQMILNVNLGTGEIRLVSVYRDTYLKIEDKERYDKINEAYFKGGHKQAIEALNENLDLTIDDYASFSWKAVADAINLLGGIKRTERQREVADLALKKAREADAATLSKVVAAVFPQISTSIGMKDMLPLMKNVKRFHLTETEGFPSKLKDVMVGKRDCVVPVTLESNVIRLHQFLFDEENYEPSDQVKEISRQIELRIKNRK